MYLSLGEAFLVEPRREHLARIYKVDAIRDDLTQLGTVVIRIKVSRVTMRKCRSQSNVPEFTQRSR
ncbi:hypothetical protein MesoLj131b_41980 [Mesorhizobium sp. 131-2-5]|nr:hypothetical protein MesoLj131b_41980 [Mesorhizobium sp. 131-2-5]